MTEQVFSYANVVVGILIFVIGFLLHWERGSMSMSIKNSIDGFLLSCKVEGKSYGTIECYADKRNIFIENYTNLNFELPR